MILLSYSLMNSNSVVLSTVTENKLQSAATSTTLSSGGVGWAWSAVLDSANLHTGTGQGSESLLGTWSGRFGSGTTHSSEFDVKGSNSQFLCTGSNILSSQHSGIWRCLITISLDF